MYFLMKSFMAWMLPVSASILFSVPALLSGQSVGFNYISPRPSAKYIQPGHNIALRHGDPFSSDVTTKADLVVDGSVSGNIAGELTLSDDHRTLIFIPDVPFAPGESVRVSVAAGLETVTGLETKAIDFEFHVSAAIPELKPESVSDLPALNIPPLFPDMGRIPANRPVNRNDIPLPDDFPEITVNVSPEPTIDHYYFMAPFGHWGFFPDAVPYLTIIDNRGIPVYYQKMSGICYDFEYRHGHLTYYGNYAPYWQSLVLNDFFEVIDQFKVKNGSYVSDFHEFELLENGHAFVMGGDAQLVGMDTVVPGGHPNAVVVGFVIQEQDQNKNVVFEWRSWDHFEITDAIEQVDLTDSIVDYAHLNAIEVVSDSELLISPRNFSEITKIDRNTGEIIWRLGGKNNMFSFVNDTLGFSFQHDCRALSNGNLTLFDNGVYHPDSQFSSVVEYQLDEDALTATLVRRVRSDPDIYGEIMGNAQATGEDGFVVGWGSGDPNLSVFNNENETVFQISIESINYRAFRFPWKTGYFSLDQESYDFGSVYWENTTMLEVFVFNHSQMPMEISGVHTSLTCYFSAENYPVQVGAGGSASLNLQFDPDTIGSYEDILTVYYDVNESDLVRRIACQAYITGEASLEGNLNEHSRKGFRLAPNPAREYVKLCLNGAGAYEQRKLHLEIISMHGKIITEETILWPLQNRIDLSGFESGIYFIHIVEKDSGEQYSLKLLKS